MGAWKGKGRSEVRDKAPWPLWRSRTRDCSDSPLNPIDNTTGHDDTITRISRPEHQQRVHPASPIDAQRELAIEPAQSPSAGRDDISVHARAQRPVSTRRRRRRAGRQRYTPLSAEHTQRADPAGDRG